MVEWKELGDVCNVHTGGQLNRNNMIENGAYPVINGGKFPSGYTNSFNEHANNITISQGGESAGYVNWIDTNFWAGAHCYVVCHDENIVKRYLYYALKNIEVILQSVKQGAGIPGLNRKTLYKQIIPIPSKSEQERIVSILDTFTSSISNLKEQIKERRKQYEYYRDQLLDLEGKDGVEWNELGDVCNVHTGGQLNRSNMIENGAYPVINGGKSPSGYTNSFNEHANNITISQGGESAGYVNWIDTNFWAGAHCYVVMHDDNLVKRYLYYALKNIEVILQSVKQGAGIPGLNRKTLYKQIIPIPSKEEQLRIVTILDQFEASIANLEAQLKEREKQYEYYRNQLLTFE